MTTAIRIALFTGATLVAAACGDNTKECGENTELDEDGYCVGTGGPAMCTNGTILDPTTNACVIDPAACQDGTVLVNGACRDPNTDLTPDVLEGAEPNGAGVVESSTTPAGEITLKPIGQAVIIKGTTNPFRDADLDGQKDADYDTYFVDVTAPTLLDISVDGTNGTMSAFLVLASAASNPVNTVDSGWIRYGMNVTGDASKRQVYLPTAGTYAIAFADTRSLFIDADSPPAAGAGGAAGNAMANYYATIQQVEMPVATPITLTAGAAEISGAIGSDIKVYAAPMGLGLNQVTLEMPGAAANPSVVVMRNNAFKTSADEGAAAADVLTAGFRATDTALIVADFTYNYGPAPEPFQLAVKTGGATALSTSGGTASQLLIADAVSDLFDLNAFYYDVSGDDEIDGIDLAWNTPVDGLLVDEELRIVAAFTYDGGFYGDTWDTYVGLMRHRTGGRYYFMVYDPAGAPGTDMITATSTIERKTPVAVVKGTPLTTQSVDTTFASNAFTYAAGVATDGWQQFNASGTGTGTLSLRFLDPGTAYGRLDDVTTVGFPAIEDFDPIFASSFAATSTTPTGRVLLDDGTDAYLVIANTATTTGTPTLDLDFERRDHRDFGTIAAAGTAMRMDESLDTAPLYRYLVRTARGSRVTTTVSPDNALLDTQLEFLAADETVQQSVNTGGVGAGDSIVREQAGTGWTAFAVSSPLALPVGTNTFDLNVAVAAPPGYTVANTTTVYADACAGGTTVTLTSNDDGTSTAFAAPAGFDFFETPVTNIRVSSNGFMVFGTTITAAAGNVDMPSTAPPNGIVAPYWDDLEQVVVCRQTTGTKLTIQWEGQVYDFFGGGPQVAFQVILDSADDSIELVYASTHVPTGAAATIGAENQSGVVAARIGFNTAAVITPGAGTKLTPM